MVIIMLITTIASSNLNWGGDRWKGIIETDGKGYYAYLPAIFIYNDLNFGFFDKIEKEKYYDENLYYDYRAVAGTKTINKYYCGTALAQLPFFLIAHTISYLCGYEADGYSALYPILINIGALFYMALGLLYLNAILTLYRVHAWSKAFTLFASVFGTHLFYYAVVEPGLSHIFSFAFVSMFLYYSIRYFSTFQNKYILFLSLILGIIVLIRPVNGLIIFIWPFTAMNWETFRQGIRRATQQKIIGVAAGCSFLLMISIQLIIYKISTGSFMIYAYREEGFNFLSPHIIDILFSYKKGLFLYTPLLLLSLSGGYFLLKSSPFAFYAWFGFFALITYVFSSWWMWYYGGSFSGRVFVEYIPLFMILLALTLKGLHSGWQKRLYNTLVIVLILICQIQTYQYRYYQIHWSDMTREKYWDVFLRIDRLINPAVTSDQVLNLPAQKLP